MPFLKVRDSLYGNVRLHDAILIQLIASPSMQRLKGLHQFGIPAEYYPYPSAFSRYDHSIGVCLLLRQLGAPLEDQIVGLLHDVSHRAFSHVYDWVAIANSPDHNAAQEIANQQDIIHQDFLLRSELPVILHQHGFDPIAISQLAKYPLVDRSLPHLCADRIDYALRELPPLTAKTISSQLAISQGRIVCRSVIAAQLFAQSYLKLQQQRWGSAEHILRYQLFAQILHRAMELQLITEADFWLDDKSVMSKFVFSNDAFIQQGLQQLRQPHMALSMLPQHIQKFRYIDPEIIFGNTTKRLSEIHHGFALELHSAQEAHTQSIPVLASV